MVIPVKPGLGAVLCPLDHYASIGVLFDRYSHPSRPAQVGKPRVAEVEEAVGIYRRFKGYSALGFFLPSSRFLAIFSPFLA